MARTKLRGVQHSPWEYGTNQRRPGLPTRSQCREFLRELQKAPHRAKFSLSTGVGFWLGDHPPGDQCPTLGPEGRLRPTVYCQCSKVMFHGRVLLEFGVSARYTAFCFSLSQAAESKFAHASAGAFVCPWIGRHDELHCAMVFKTPGLCGHHKLLRARI